MREVHRYGRNEGREETFRLLTILLDVLRERDNPRQAFDLDDCNISLSGMQAGKHLPRLIAFG